MKIKKFYLLCVILGLLHASLIFSSCDEEKYDEGIYTTRLRTVSGDNQVERTGALLPDPLVVRTRDILGHPHSGIEVRFTTAAPGASVTPSIATTDSDGLASFRFSLGSEPGTQYASVACDDDSIVFTATALEVRCDEESLGEVDDWPSGQIMITTSSSSLLEGSASVLLRYDPGTNNIEKVLGTDQQIIDLAFSPRGELFLASDTEIFKVNAQTLSLESYAYLPFETPVEIEPNPGGVLACTSYNTQYLISCPQYELSPFATLPSAPQNMALDQEERTVYLVRQLDQATYTVTGSIWDGRSDITGYDYSQSFTSSSAKPVGMCVDTTGTVYVVLDGDATTRSIVAFDSQLGPERVLFDFYDYFGGNNTEAGRWGDIAVHEGVLYLIDRLNDRIVSISTSGGYLGAYESDAFSLPGAVFDSERYGIAVIP